MDASRKRLLYARKKGTLGTDEVGQTRFQLQPKAQGSRSGVRLGDSLCEVVRG